MISLKIKRNEFIDMMAFMKPRKWVYFLGLIGNGATEASILIILPFIMKLVIDASVNGDITLLKKGVFLAGVEAVLVSVLFIVTGRWLHRSVQKTMNEVRLTMFKHVQRLAVSYFERNHSGDILSRMSNDLGVMQQAYGGQLRNVLFVTFSGVGSAVSMFLLDWKIGLILIFIGIISAVINTKFILFIRKITNQLQKTMGALTERMTDIFGGIQVTRMFHLEEVLLERFHEKNKQVFSLSMKKVKTGAVLDCSNFVISWINFGGIIGMGALLVASGKIQFGTVVAMMNLLGHVNFMIRRLGNILSNLQNSLSGTGRVMELLKEPQEPLRYPVEGLKDEVMIGFEDVAFSYEEEKTVLKGLQLKVKQGQVAALVGSSGGGKSTIVKMLLGYYPPCAGKITINGKPLGSYELAELRKLIAYVPQDAYMFDGTVEENIRFGKPDASQEELISAAKAANAHGFIEEMREGYATVVGERGIRLSGGQRQRIAIARAILKDAPILLLDEATSSLDSQSEQLVQEALGILMKGRTAVVIAHRLSTIENADVIYVISEGMVAEKGKHMELLENDGMYKYLHSLQFCIEESIAG